MKSEQQCFGIFFVIFSSHFFIFKLTNAAEIDEIEANRTEFLSTIIPPKYNKDIRPLFGKTPVRVNVSIGIEDLYDVSEQKMELTTDLEVIQCWDDPRLDFSNRSTNLSYIILTRDFTSKIWFPDTFFSNSKEVKSHKTVNDADTTQLILTQNGRVIYTTKMTVVARCQMDLSFFPVDQQRCELRLRSYSNGRIEIEYRWLTKHSVTTNEHIYLPTFRLLGYSRLEKDLKLTTGRYSTLSLYVHISRNIAFYFTRIYQPAFLVVIISFVPFWLARDSHARVALGVTTVLTMTTLITNTNSELPKISHLTVLDVYLFFCFTLVFASLIEYAIVGYYDLVKETSSSGDEDENSNSNDEEPDKEKKSQKKNTKHENHERANFIDYTSRMFFPAVFGLFNVLYVLGLVYIVLQNKKVYIEVKVHESWF